MNYKIEKGKIIVPICDEFNPDHILECGQVFRFTKTKDCWNIFSANKNAKIIKKDANYHIVCEDCEYFAKYFDLDNDYTAIKSSLEFDKILSQVIPFGKGIRILKGDLVEIIFSFVISANNNILRIQRIIERLCEGAGENMGDFYAFPSLEKLSTLPLEFYSNLGAGYRDKYLFNLSRQLKDVDFNQISQLSTDDLRNWLISMPGIGPKVADCILLFGFGRMDVFPVDTWIEKVYIKFYNEGEKNRTQIAKFFVNRFGALSGYAQQYLFYGARSFNAIKNL